MDFPAARKCRHPRAGFQPQPLHLKLNRPFRGIF